MQLCLEANILRVYFIGSICEISFMEKPIVIMIKIRVITLYAEFGVVYIIISRNLLLSP